MKLTINNDLIKAIEKKLKKYAYCRNDIVEVQEINIDFIEGTYYTFTISWGHDKGKDVESEWHTKEFFISEADFSLDFLAGMFYQFVCDLEDRETK